MAEVSELAVYHLVDKMRGKKEIKKIYRAHAELQERFKRKGWEDRFITVAVANEKEYKKELAEESKFEKKLRKKYSLANNVKIARPDYHFRKDTGKLYAVRKFEPDSYMLSKFYPSVAWFFLFRDNQRLFDPEYFKDEGGGNLWYVSTVKESLELLEKRLPIIENMKVKVEIKGILTQREYSWRNLNVLLKLLKDKFGTRESIIENIEEMELDHKGILNQVCWEYVYTGMLLLEGLYGLKSWLNKWEPEDEIVLDYAETARDQKPEKLEKDHMALDIEEWLQRLVKEIKD